MKRHVWSLVVLVYIFACSPVYAQSSDVFRVQMNIGALDTTPPSAPSPLTATPVAATQINLAWGVSVDDVALGGYQVFRDAVQIATTTLTTYADTGLVASTTYSYFVRAFDTSSNVSSSSVTVATTTLGITPTSTTSATSGDAQTDVTLQSLQITPDIYAATLSWKTSRFAQFELRWGRTTSYELGFVTNEVFKREHTTVITDLESGTTYEYELIAYNKDGFRTVLSQGQFTTLDIPDSVAPSNVWNLQAVRKGSDVALSWNNPRDPDFAYVRMVRSHLFYPIDPYDGFIAYQGTGASFFDTNALSTRGVQYYTIFSYDKNGNVSSGATVAVFNGERPVYQTSTTSPALNLTFADVEMLQRGSVVSPDTLDAGYPVTLRIAYEKLPEHLKTIIITITDPEDTTLSFSFLLRINKDKTYYEAIVAALPEGVYPTTVTVFDYKTHVVTQAQGALTFVKSDSLTPTLPALFARTSDTLLVLAFFTFVLLLLLLLLLIKNTRLKRMVPILASFGGAFVLLFILAPFAVSVMLQQTQHVQVAALPLTPFTSVSGLVFVLLTTSVCAALIFFLVRTKK